MKRYIIPIVLAVLVCAGSTRAAEVYGADPGVFDLYAGDHYLARWRVPEAREAVDRALKTSADSRKARLADAHVAFFEGRYDYALKVLDREGIKGPFRQLVSDTAQSVGKMKSRKSAHFEIFWSDPRDELLVDDGLKGLEEAREALGKELGYLPEKAVRVEIYPSVSEFTAASTLTRKEIDTTGIVGLCKFDRLLITSPRSTAWGYRWRDTLSHEYLHLLIYRLSQGEAPIWVHEGMAKYLEGAWRGRKGRLEPYSMALLADRAKKGTLIPLEKMSPSIAKLPSAEDASLAFAQVATMMDFLVGVKGPGAIPAILKRIAGGESDRAALEKVYGKSFDQFEKDWLERAKALPSSDEEVEIVATEIKEDAADAETKADRVRDPAARDFVRLGDMLRMRSRMKAASEEYAKAFALSPRSPVVVSRHAMGRLLTGDPKGALLAVDGVLNLYEDMAVLWSRKGDALLALDRFAESRAAYLELMEINPFHLPGREGLLEIALKTGDDAAARAEREKMELLTKEGVFAPADHGATGRER